jgi:hypothetical protein
VFSPELIIANRRILELQAEASANRLAKLAKGHEDRSNPIAGALKSLRSILGNPADAPSQLPKLNDYPYRI